MHARHEARSAAACALEAVEVDDAWLSTEGA
jgi:hypothetical protein